MSDGAMRHGWRLVVLGILGVSLAAQAPAPVRAPHVGRVRGADGKPVAEAEVTFVAAREFAATDSCDVVRATSDPNGRFRVELLPTRSYQAWATVKRADGQHVTALTARGAATTDLVFTADITPAPVRLRLPIHGTEAWAAQGPLRVELAVAGCAALVPPATLGADAGVPLPPLPDLTAEVVVFARDRFVYSTVTSLRHDVTLPEATRVAVLVQDEQGKPVAGATLQRVASLWSHGESPLPTLPSMARHQVAVTDAEGKAELLFAHRGDPFQGVGWPPLVFVASKAGYGESVSGFSGVPFCNGERRPKQNGGTLSFTLAAQAAQPAKVQALAGRLPRELGLMAAQTLPYDGDSTTSAYDFVRVPVAEDGAVGVPASAKQWSLQAIHVPDLTPPLAADDPFRRAAAPHTLVLPPTALHEAGGLDLRRMVPLRVQVLDPTSGPAMGALVVCTPKNGSEFIDAYQAMRGTTDAAGRLVLPVMPGTWLLVVLQGGTWAMATLEVGSTLDVQTLQLAPLDRMPVRVIDADGKPVAGARFENSGASWRSGGSAEDAFLCGLGNHVSSWLLQQQVTDADGRATLPFMKPRLLKIDFTVRADKLASNRELHLRADEETTEIVVK